MRAGQTIKRMTRLFPPRGRVFWLEGVYPDRGAGHMIGGRSEPGALRCKHGRCVSSGAVHVGAVPLAEARRWAAARWERDGREAWARVTGAMDEWSKDRIR